MGACCSDENTSSTAAEVRLSSRSRPEGKGGKYFVKEPEKIHGEEPPAIESEIASDKSKGINFENLIKDKEDKFKKTDNWFIEKIRK